MSKFLIKISDNLFGNAWKECFEKYAYACRSFGLN